jgi:hypothetical protein
VPLKFSAKKFAADPRKNDSAHLRHDVPKTGTLGFLKRLFSK